MSTTLPLGSPGVKCSKPRATGSPRPWPMSGTLAQFLLRIAAAVAPDGGAAVRAVLQSVLQDQAPFEAGEIVFAPPSRGPRFFPWDGPPSLPSGSGTWWITCSPTAPPSHRRPARRGAFPDTAARMRERGLRSVLVLPFRFDQPGMVEVAVALAGRSHGWAFAGASLPPWCRSPAWRGSPSTTRCASPASASARMPWRSSRPGVAPAAEGQPARERETPPAAKGGAGGRRGGPRGASRGSRGRARAAGPPGGRRGPALEAERLRDEWAHRRPPWARAEEQGAAMQALKRRSRGPASPRPRPPTWPRPGPGSASWRPSSSRSDRSSTALGARDAGPFAPGPSGAGPCPIGVRDAAATPEATSPPPPLEGLLDHERRLTFTPLFRAGSNRQVATARSTASSRTFPADPRTRSSVGSPLALTIVSTVTVPSCSSRRAISG